MNENLSPQQKAGKKNHKRSEQRKAMWKQALEEKELLRREMNYILKNPNATPAEKIQAAHILLGI